MNKQILDMLKCAAYYNIELTDFWDSTPKELLYIIEGKRDRIIDERNFSLQVGYDTASLAAVGVLNPKNFPKNPSSISNVKKSSKFIDINASNQDSVMDELESVFLKGFGSDSDIEEVTIQM